MNIFTIEKVFPVENVSFKNCKVVEDKNLSIVRCPNDIKIGDKIVVRDIPCWTSGKPLIFEFVRYHLNDYE